MYMHVLKKVRATVLSKIIAPMFYIMGKRNRVNKSSGPGGGGVLDLSLGKGVLPGP